jgi:hypothetical protein
MHCLSWQHRQPASHNLLNAVAAYRTDHYTGINENWSAGPIYCSEVTAQLVVHLTGVQQQFVHPLPMEKPVAIHGMLPDHLLARHWS